MNPLTILYLLTTALAAKYEEYPLSELDKSAYQPYKSHESVKIECISRQIDNGEHIFDSNGDIVYVPFANCLESNAPLDFKYNQNENRKCTIKFEDNIFHLFQLYLHKDVPFTCRLQSRPNSQIYIPIDLSFRGNVLDSHIDIDTNLNVMLLNNNEDEIVAGTGFASSTNTTKAIIGSNVEFQLNINWINTKRSILNEDLNLGVYWLPNQNSLINWIFLFSGLLFGVVCTLIFTYRSINKKIQLNTWNKVE